MESAFDHALQRGGGGATRLICLSGCEKHCCLLRKKNVRKSLAMYGKL